MATTKDFTIKQYNGTDYDVLEPSSVSSQIHLSAEIVAKLNALGVTTTDDLDKLLDSLTVRVWSSLHCCRLPECGNRPPTWYIGHQSHW